MLSKIFILLVVIFVTSEATWGDHAKSYGKIAHGVGQTQGLIYNLEGELKMLVNLKTKEAQELMDGLKSEIKRHKEGLKIRLNAAKDYLDRAVPKAEKLTRNALEQLKTKIGEEVTLKQELEKIENDLKNNANEDIIKISSAPKPTAAIPTSAPKPNQKEL